MDFIKKHENICLENIKYIPLYHQNNGINVFSAPLNLGINVFIRSLNRGINVFLRLVEYGINAVSYA